MCHLIANAPVTIVAKAKMTPQMRLFAPSSPCSPKPASNPHSTDPPSLLHHAASSRLTPVPVRKHPCLSPAGVLVCLTRGNLQDPSFQKPAINVQIVMGYMHLPPRHLDFVCFSRCFPGWLDGLDGMKIPGLWTRFHFQRSTVYF